MKLLAKMTAAVLGCTSFAVLAAPDLKMWGRAYSDTNCGIYSTSSADFRLDITDVRIRDSSDVKVNVAFHDTWTQNDGKGAVNFNLPTGGPGKRSVIFGPLQVDSRRTFYYDEIQITYEIRDVFRTILEHGGSNTNFFSADVPGRECSRGDWRLLSVRP